MNYNMRIQSALNLGACGLLAVLLAASPAQLLAQTTNKSSAKSSAAEKKQPAEKKPKTVPFNGELTAVDKVAKTITVGKRVFQLTSETKLYKGEKTPATLDEGVVGQPVRGSYHKTEDGKLIANSVYFGPKTEPKSSAPPKKDKNEK